MPRAATSGRLHQSRTERLTPSWWWRIGTRPYFGWSGARCFFGRGGATRTPTRDRRARSGEARDHHGLHAEGFGIVGHVALFRLDVPADERAFKVGRAKGVGEQRDVNRGAADVEPGDDAEDADGRGSSHQQSGVRCQEKTKA